VRYDTGDNATVAEYKGNYVYSLSSITGRTAEQLFTASGSPISSLILGPHIYKPLTDTGLNSQFQFAQIDKATYELRLKIAQEQMPTDTVSMIIENLKQVLGTDAQIKLSFVADIAPLPSGKRPIYKNEMPK
jgi:phenylacetate-coenzyme A ligase PaaK-like adenylate-forming protein